MLNNHTQIRQLLENNFKEHPGSFHLIQVITRGKDLKALAKKHGEPEPGATNQTIKNYIIYDINKFDRYWPEIMRMCDVFDARAYVWPQPRSIQKLNQHIIKDLSTNMVLGNNVNPLRAVVSCIGEMIPEERLWVIDIDKKDKYYLEAVTGTILQYSIDKAKVIKHIVPTASGYHLLTGKFNTEWFRTQFPEIDIHKNNPTILYIPTSITELYEEEKADSYI